MSSDEDMGSDAGSEEYGQDLDSQSGSEGTWQDDSPFRFFDLPAELQTKIFTSIDDILTVLALRLACRSTNKIFLRSKPAVLASVRNKLIKPILDHYEFLTNYAIPESELLRPPQAGWPQLAAHTTQSTGKSELVLEILRHLPYFKGENHYDGTGRPSLNLIDYKSRVVDWLNWRVGERSPDDGQEHDFLDNHDDEDLGHETDWSDPDCGSDEDEDKDKDDDDDDQSESRAPSNIQKWKNPKPFRRSNTICIASGRESGGITLMLDTLYGFIHECSIRCYCQTLSAVDYFQDKQQVFKDCRAMLVRGYHEPDLKETILFAERNGMAMTDYDSMPALAQVEPNMPGEDFSPDVDFGWVRHLLRKHGWPSSDWRMVEAQQAIKEYRMRREAQAP